MAQSKAMPAIAYRDALKSSSTSAEAKYELHNATTNKLACNDCGCTVYAKLSINKLVDKLKAALLATGRPKMSITTASNRPNASSSIACWTRTSL